MDWFNGIAEKLRKAYEGMNPDSAIARNAKKTIQQVDGLVQMWADMAVDAAENYRTAENENGNLSTPTGEQAPINTPKANSGTVSKENVAQESESVKRNSIRETDDGRMVAVVDDDILSHIDTATWDDSKIEAAKKAASSALAKFSGGISVDGITRKVNKTSRREYTRSNYTESLAKKDKATFADKMRLADVADDVVTVTTGWQKDGGLLHQRKDNFVDFDHGHALLMAGEINTTQKLSLKFTTKKQGEKLAKFAHNKENRVENNFLPCFVLVEPRGIEPLSESNLERTSPGAVCYLHSLIRTGTNTLPESVAS